MVDAIVWWVTLQLLGLAALPIGAALLRGLPDRGYSVSKPLGLLLVGWLCYILSMVQILPFGRIPLVICLLLVAGLSAWLLLRRDRALLNDLRAHFFTPASIRYIVVCEVLFAIAYITWAVVRAYNPSIVDQEKFMDFGFLNAILKSEHFPPNDMWLAGFSINYYYFGYVLVAALTSLSGVASQVGFNLAIVTLFSMTALGAFGVVYNLIAGRLEVRVAAAAVRTRRAATAPVEATAAVAATSQVPQRRARAGVGAGAPAPQVKAEQPATGSALPARRTRSQASGATAMAAKTATASETAQPAGVDGRDGLNGNAPHGGVPANSAGGAATPGPAYMAAYEGTVERRQAPWFLSPYIFGVIAALMVVAIGNLTTGFANPGNDTMEGNGWRFCFMCQSAQTFNWWQPSRVIQDYRTTSQPGAAPTKEKVGFETINEFPAFSFLLADMHPHVLALPLVLLAITLAMALARRRVLRAGTWRDGVPPGLVDWLSIVIIGIIAGSLYTTNTWDYPTYLLVILVCMAVPYLAFARRRGEGWRWLMPYAVQAVLVVILSLATYIPFHLTFKSLVGGEPAQIPENLANIPVVGWVLEKLGGLVLINTADKTILGFIVIFGIFLAALLVWLLYEFVSFLRRSQQGREGPALVPYYWGIFLLVVFIAAFLFKFPLLALLLPMAAIALAMVWSEPSHTERNVALVLLAVAALIGLAIEVVFLRDNFQMRMNTLFKFYYQIWVMWALASGYALWRVLYAAFGQRAPAPATDRQARAVAPASDGLSIAGKVALGAWAVASLFLVFTGLLYTVYGVQSRQVHGQSGPVGLDGSAWMRDSLPGDYATANWLKDNATGSDRVLEAGSAEYDWTGRISAFSGVPTLLAWDNSHEMLWRTNQPDAKQQITERRQVVNSIYQGTDPVGGATLTSQRLLDILNQYQVDYVVVGPIERGQRERPENARTNEQVTPYMESLFKYTLAVAFSSGDTTLYKVGKSPSGTGPAPTTPVPGVTPGAFDPNAAPAGLFEHASPGANRGQFKEPRGITRDAQGNFYVVDTQNMRVQKFDPTGKFLSMFGSKGTSDGQFNPFSDEAAGTGPGGIAVDSQGNIYVADTWNHRIQKFDANGKFLTAWGSFVNLSDPSGQSDPDKNIKFFGPRGVATGPDGNIYVTDTGNKRVSIFKPDGTFVREISSNVTPEKTSQNYAYSQPGEMNEPIGIAVDKAGNVYVADTNNHRIQKFDANGKPVAQWPVPDGAWSPGPYLEPFLALDGAGNVYATAPTGKAVLKFDPNGKLLGQKSQEGGIALNLPTGITVDAGGTTYVVDTDRGNVIKLGQVP